jgi:hypothetical protein
MAATRTGIAMEFEAQAAERRLYRRTGCAGCPKSGLSREFFISLMMCFPLSCMLWAAIVYGAVRLAR